MGSGAGRGPCHLPIRYRREAARKARRTVETGRRMGAKGGIMEDRTDSSTGRKQVQTELCLQKRLCFFRVFVII